MATTASQKLVQLSCKLHVYNMGFSGFVYLIIDGFADSVSNWLGSGGFVDTWFSYGDISMSVRLPCAFGSSTVICAQ